MQPLSKSLLSRYTSLKYKKYRDQYNQYIISGFNAVETAIQSRDISIESLIIRDDQIQRTRQLQQSIVNQKRIPIYQLNLRQFIQLSDERNPQGVAVVVNKPANNIDPDHIAGPAFIYLDKVNDPGNLGTIIRTACWFDVKTILLSPNSADPFQPKTTRASAGLVSHIQVGENLDNSFLTVLKMKFNYKLIGASVNGDKLLTNYKFNAALKYGFVFGSEAQGISPQIDDLLDEKISIPSFGPGESLNLAASTAIFLSEYKRQTTRIINK